MDIGRAEKIADVMKSVKGLGKSIKKPVVPRGIEGIPGITDKIAGKSAAGDRLINPSKGNFAVSMLLYFFAGILTVALILLIIDQWITPVFQRVPGGSGYIPIPGTDTTQNYWLTNSTVANIKIGTVANGSTSSSGPPGSSSICLTFPASGNDASISKTTNNNNNAEAAASAASARSAELKLATTVIEQQPVYTITMDVYINDETPQAGLDTTGNDISYANQRTFFVLGSNPDLSISTSVPLIVIYLKNIINTVVIQISGGVNNSKSIEIENVPIYSPFRIGIAVSSNVMEGYLNGMLVKTVSLDQNKAYMPLTGQNIYAPAVIKSRTNILSKGIQVLNIRTFGYMATPSEMQGRMSDLKTETVFKSAT